MESASPEDYEGLSYVELDTFVLRFEEQDLLTAQFVRNLIERMEQTPLSEAVEETYRLPMCPRPVKSQRKAIDGASTSYSRECE